MLSPPITIIGNNCYFGVHAGVELLPQQRCMLHADLQDKILIMTQ